MSLLSVLSFILFFDSEDSDVIGITTNIVTGVVTIVTAVYSRLATAAKEMASVLILQMSGKDFKNCGSLPDL